jgi:hypothetical protein
MLQTVARSGLERQAFCRRRGFEERQAKRCIETIAVIIHNRTMRTGSKNYRETE